MSVAENDRTVTLLQNASAQEESGNSKLEPAENVNVIIDLNGFTLFGTGNISVFGTVTVKDSVGTGKITTAADKAVKVLGNVTIQNGATIPGNTEISDNDILNMVGGTAVHINTSGGMLFVSGDTLGSSDITQSGIKVSGSARLTVSGTANINNLEITGATASVTVSGGTIENMTLNTTVSSMVRILNGTVKKLSIGSHASILLLGGTYEEIISSDNSLISTNLSGSASWFSRYLFQDENGNFLNETVSASGKHLVKSATVGAEFSIVYHSYMCSRKFRQFALRLRANTDT